MMLLTVILTIISVLCIWKIATWFSKLLKAKAILRRMPGPEGYPIIGDILSVLGVPTDQLWCYLRKLASDYYPIYKYWHFHNSLVSLLCPEDIEIILSTTKHITKSEIYDRLHPWLGTGLLTSTGSKWQRRRKILTTSFHFNILQEFIPTVTEETEVLVKQLQEECDKPHTNIVPLITDFTLNTICGTAMGTRLEKSDKKSLEYVRAIYKMGEVIFLRLTRPWLYPDVTFKLSSTYQEQKKLLNILHGFSKAIIKEREMNLKGEDSSNFQGTGKKKRLAMLDLLISAKNSGEPIDDEGIREEVDTFMFEGHDTTTACICFTLLALAYHTDIQNKVLEELQSIFGDSNRTPTFQDLQNMHYLEQVLKESLRMYPSVPFISRVTDEEIKTHSGYTIPANTILYIHVYDLHHNPDIYPEPEKFDPDRFLPENVNKRHPFAYIPFSAGPRNCIGQKFAFLEIKTVISSILRNYILESVDTPSDITFICHLVLKTKAGIKIKFRKRCK